ncbi:MAG: hypothetical protein ABI273_05510 [Lacunisphaera sp.]
MDRASTRYLSSFNSPQGRRWRFPWLRIAVIIASFSTLAARAAMPAYLHEALQNFVPEVPPHWAFSLTTVQEGRRTSERFDPSQSPTEQWSLLETEGRKATPQDIDKYFRYKARQVPGPIKATFHKDDIEPGTLQLVRENAEHAVYHCTFREVSSNTDKMLGHLSLLLTINKRLGYVERYRMTLDEPYSPVFSVKMNELVVTMDFSPPDATHPSLPARSSSHFVGRIFLLPTGENITERYFDFTRVR